MLEDLQCESPTDIFNRLQSVWNQFFYVRFLAGVLGLISRRLSLFLLEAFRFLCENFAIIEQMLQVEMFYKWEKHLLQSLTLKMAIKSHCRLISVFYPLDISTLSGFALILSCWRFDQNSWIIQTDLNVKMNYFSIYFIKGWLNNSYHSGEYLRRHMLGWICLLTELMGKHIDFPVVPFFLLI